MKSPSPLTIGINKSWCGDSEMVKRIFFMCTWFFALAATACTPFSTDYRVKGFKFTQQAFDSFEQSPDLYRVVELERVRIHIVGSRRFLPDYVLAHGSGVVGYATSNNDIYLFGKEVGGRIIVNQAILGHELNHLLHYSDPEIANPDQLNDLEYRHFINPLPQPLHQLLMQKREP